MGRNPSPANRSGKAKLVKPFGIVVGNATCQYLPLPSIRWNFKSLQLAKHFESCAFALHLRSRRDMLPSQQPAHELRSGDGLNLLTQRGDGKAVNARQQPPVAPFLLPCGRMSM